MSSGAASNRAGATSVGGSCRALDGDELLAASGIGKRFGRKLVLEDAALSAKSGEAVAIVGENGAGKSTLLRICAGLGHATQLLKVLWCSSSRRGSRGGGY